MKIIVRVSVLVVSLTSMLAVPHLSLAAAESEKSMLAEASSTELVSKLRTEQAPLSVPGKDASEIAKDYLRRKGLKRGWDDERQRAITLGVAVFDSEDPAYDDTYITARSLAAMEAKLEAKAQLIEFFRTTMSAFNYAMIPGSDLSTKLEKERNQIERKLKAQQESLAKLLEEEDVAEAENLRGATLEDRLLSLIDASIKKLDETYSAAEIAEGKKKKFDRAKKRVEEAKQDLAEVEAQLSEIGDSLKKELRSGVETIAQMPLFGATTIAQFESWDDDREVYKVAVVMLWSIKMEKIVRAMIKGEEMKVPPGKISRDKYLNDQNWCTSLGGRRFRDDKGDVWFIGIAAADIGETAVEEEGARGEAASFAMQEVAMAIFSDMSSHKAAERMSQTQKIGKKNQTVAGSSYAKELHEQIRSRDISGLQLLHDTECIHPISDRKLTIQIYGLNQTGAIAAMWAEEETYVTAVLDANVQQALKGHKQGLEGELAKAKGQNNVESAAAEASSQRVQDKVEAELSGDQSDTTDTKGAVGCSDDCDDQKESKSGTFAGAGQEDTDW